MDSCEASPNPTRNPSPPPELQQNEEATLGDSIGSTAFSKHWLFATLMKLIQEVDKETEAEEGVESESDFSVDVDEDLQTELCKLWDMSMNTEVAKFLQEFKAIEILTGVISKSKAPRVIEICIGILGNMACDNEVCVEIASNEKLVNLTLALLGNDDPPTLVETTRLLYTNLSHQTACQMWLKAIERASLVQDQVAFIFHSSTNNVLLKNTADFVDVLLDLSDELRHKWATTEMVDSLLEAIQQTGHKHSETLEVFLHVFQLLSTTEPGVEVLVEKGETVLLPLLQYLECVCEDEIVSLDDHSACLSSVFSLLHALFASDTAIAEKLSTSSQLLRCMVKVLEPLYPSLHNKNENTQGEDCSSSIQTLSDDHQLLSSVNQNASRCHIQEDQSEGDDVTCSATQQDSGRDKDKSKDNVSSGDLEPRRMRQYKMLFDVLQMFLRHFFRSLQIDQVTDEEVEEDKKASEKTSKPIFFPVLVYLETSCSRYRIICLALTLMDADRPYSAESPTSEYDAGASSTRPRLSADIEHLRQLCQTYDQTRVVRILDDVVQGKVLNRTDSGEER
ncbi:protein saal1-like [Pomacea canaliculata]|nr:protein saal1-like [Pomacea canaliculata]XP_025086884.1 protein saal1-like [Pomacea canaliculata]